MGHWRLLERVRIEGLQSQQNHLLRRRVLGPMGSLERRQILHLPESLRQVLGRERNQIQEDLALW